jgi:hypothetical protein
MTTLPNVEILEVARRSVKSCCRGCGWLSPRFLTISATILLWSSAAQAQIAVGPVVGGYWGGGVGTAESSAAHGYADMIRSEGYYNMMTAQGMVQAEQARAQYIQNRNESFRSYLAGKEQRTAVDAQKRERGRHSVEALNLAAKSALPQPLGSDAINPETGKINWPKALLDSRYTAKRTELEHLFELRNKTSGGANSQTKIQVAAGEMTAILKSNITKMSSTDYMKARKFLDSLTAASTQS